MFYSFFLAEAVVFLFLIPEHQLNLHVAQAVPAVRLTFKINTTKAYHSFPPVCTGCVCVSVCAGGLFKKKKKKPISFFVV